MTGAIELLAVVLALPSVVNASTGVEGSSLLEFGLRSSGAPACWAGDSAAAELLVDGSTTLTGVT